MKNKIQIYALIFIILIFLQGCKKDESTDSLKTVAVTMKANQTYQYDLGSFGDEEGASITRQASHAQISKIERITESGKTIYTYVPTLNYVGTDEVEIKTERGSDGASPSTEIITIIIKFTVTN